MKQLLEYFYKTIDKDSGLPFESMAGLEAVLDRLDKMY
jgi:hypothetical protein